MQKKSFSSNFCKLTLLLITALYFAIQITLQYPTSFAKGYNFLKSSPIIQVLAGLQLNLTLSHMFAPFETSTVVTRIRYRFKDGSEDLKDRTAYRAPYRRSLANLIEARFIVRSSNQKELPQDVLGFLQYKCKTLNNLSSIAFEKATISIEPILMADGLYKPNYQTTLEYNCLN